LTKKELNTLIDSTNRIEQICDDTLEVLYYKYNKIPKIRQIKEEMALLEGKELKLIDQLFYKNLKVTYVHMYKVPILEYLELWCYERNIPYTRKLRANSEEILCKMC